MSVHRGKASAELRRLANRSTCHFSTVLWCTTLVVYSYAIAIYVQLSTPPCKCSAKVRSLEAAQCIQYRSEDACDPIRWALWESNDKHDHQANYAIRSMSHNSTTRLFEGNDSADRLADEHPESTHIASNYTFYGRVSKTSPFSPDRVLFSKFFSKVDFRPNLSRSNSPLLNGVFVEVGAGDGITNSNSLFFEKELNWTGLLIEGAKPNIERLRLSQGRASSTKKIYLAACDMAGPAQMIGEGESAALVDIVTQMRREALEGTWSPEWRAPYNVLCERLGQIFETNGISKVDLLSIDVEGSELQVLQGLDLDMVSVRVVVINLPLRNGTMEKEARAILEAKNFCMAARVGSNEYWTSDVTFRKYLCGWSSFRYPP